MSKYFFIGAIYWLFVIYGSLVPLDYKPLPYDQALTQFENIRYLNLGIDSRADWVANILLYIPLAFLFLANFRPFLKTGFFSKVIISILTFAFCITTAVAIEFFQQFFPPRTVSLNDLIAEAIGTGLGMVLWFLGGEKAIAYSRQMTIGNWVSIKAAIILYFPIYLFLSLFPFDFVTSISELNNKLANGSDTFFIDIDKFLNEPFRVSLKWLLEIVVLMPLGALFAALPYVPNRKALAVVLGFLLGSVIEFTQLFIYTGSAQGFSIVTRILGMAFGVKAYDYLVDINLKKLRPWLGVLVGFSCIPYVVILAAVNGWFEGDWVSITAAQQKLNETHLLPFYYFYYTTETVALISLLSNIGMYMPVGILFWIYGLKNKDGQTINGFWVGMTASILSIVMETGKLFLKAKHVDPTDVLIAFVAGAATYGVLGKIQASRRESDSGGRHARYVYEQDSATVDYVSSAERLSINKSRLLPAGLIGILIVYQVIQYPVKPGLLALFLCGYCYVLSRWPLSGLFVLPASLPLMDFAPWTGRFYFDEFDLTILSTIMMFMIRQPDSAEQRPTFRFIDYFIIDAFVLLLCISFFIGLLPLQNIDANSFSSYYSQYNALRVVKGFFWVVLLGPYLIRLLACDNGRKVFSTGVLVGLTGLTIFSIFERWVFPGLFDYSTDYRINALFSTMHTGGGHIESYLALTMPFIAILVLSDKPQVLTKAAGALLFMLSLYTLLMTFSRGGAIGISVGFLVLLVGVYFYYDRQHRLKIGSGLVLVSLLFVAVAVLAVPVFKGDLMKSRISVAEKDSEIRYKHWSDAIEMMDRDFLTQLFGMGLGSFPRTFFWSNQENAYPATYRIESESGNRYLALQGGDALFMGQYISLEPKQPLSLSADVRTRGLNAALSIPICEKSLQYSFRCVSVEIDATSQQWQHVEIEIDSGDVGVPSPDIAGGWLTRPVQLALYAGGDAERIIEVDNLGLRDTKGNNLIVNGDFSDGTDHWFFSTEQHNPWHIFNIWVHVLFDMGWLGLSTFCLLIAYIYYRLIKSTPVDIYAPVLLAAFTGFMIIGYVDSPFDAPRLSFLFFALVIFAVFGVKRPDRSFR
ncbi:VanZ family protein [Methylomonas sp. MgM2]